jgi:hypothetical protein
VTRKRKNPPQCLVWFRLNGLGSSQNGQNSFIQNWCTGGCWFTLAGHAIVSTHNSFPRWQFWSWKLVMVSYME